MKISVYLFSTILIITPTAPSFATASTTPANDRFGNVEAHNLYIARSKDYVQQGDYGRAVLEWEPIFAQNDAQATRGARRFLFEEKELSMALFRSAAREGLIYYNCVFGTSRMDEILSRRLNIFGDIMPVALKDKRQIELKEFVEANFLPIDSTRECATSRQAFTSVWVEGVDELYAVNEKHIKAKQKQDQIEFVAAERSRAEAEKKRVATAPARVGNLSSDSLCVAYGDLIRSNYSSSFLAVNDLQGLPKLIQTAASELSRRKISVSKPEVMAGQVRLGNSRCSALAALGIPTTETKSVGSWGAKNQLVYPDRTYIYLDNGRVTSWQESQ